MAVKRGSQSTILVIAEATYGVTPATPTMVEIPIVSFTPTSAIGAMRSEQIRSHPFVDKMLEGLHTHEIGTDFELQPGVHDILLETIFGAPFTANAVKLTDAIRGLSTETRNGGATTLYDHFLGLYLNRLSITAAASDTAPVRMSASGMALSGTLDDAATIATSVTAAANPDPFVFADASLLVNSVATDVVSGTINIERQVDPLNVWGRRTAREYVPGAVTVTGTATIPYDDGAQSTLFEAWTNAPLSFTFANKAGTLSYNLAIPNSKFVSLGRAITDRGARFQEINWEAYYDSVSATAATLTRDITP